MNLKNFEKLEKKLGIKFLDKNLLQQAFVHRSCLNENPNLKIDHNERLEFLGDAVIELAVTRHLFKNFPNPEGELTSWRAALVNSVMLSKISTDLGLNDYLMLSKGEAQDVGRARQIILANTFEAVVGAIYIDQGFEAAEKFVEENVLCELPRILEEKLYVDPKSYFQEKAQGEKGITPKYELLKEEGPDHNKSFIVGVYLESKLVTKGKGHSKQEAQEDAARKGLKKMNWE